MPGTEGKAGMGVIVKDPEMPPLDMDKFLEKLKCEVPVYALPLFVRVVSNIDSTGSFSTSDIANAFSLIQGYLSYYWHMSGLWCLFFLVLMFMNYTA